MTPSDKSSLSEHAGTENNDPSTAIEPKLIEKFWDKPRAARELGISQRTVDRIRRRGLLRYIEHAGKVLILPAWAGDYLMSQEKKRPGPRRRGGAAKAEAHS